MTTKIKLANNVADVDLTTTAPTNGQGLIYNSTSSKWVPGAAGGGVTAYDTIDDLPLSDVDEGALALVKSTDKLYLWMNTGWYNIATINTNPSITGGNETPYLLATDGTPTEITLIASDPEGIPLTWSYEVTSGSLTNGGGTTATVSNVDNVFTVTPTTTEAYAGEFSLTFKASDGVNLGTSVAQFTLVFRVIDSKYTSLLVKALSSGANSTFVDSSTNNFTIAKNGDVTQGTFSPFSQPEGAWSNYFDGTGDYLTVSSAAVPATGAFTLEFLFNATDLSVGRMELFSQYAAGVEGRFTISVSDDGSNGKVSAFIGTSLGNIALYSTNAVTVGEWTHVALLRDASNNFYLYINGALEASDTGGKSVSIYTSSCYVGIRGDLAEPWLGYISNVRVTTSEIIPPSGGPTNPLTDVTNTSLLTCQSNRFKDNNTQATAKTITPNGNVSVSPFGPFDRLAYDPAVHGGGAYFPNTAGTKLNVPASTNLDMGTGDFSVEAFIYLEALPTSDAFSTSAGGYQGIFGSGPDNKATGAQLYIGTTNIKFDIAADGAGPINTAHGFKAKEWHHVVITRSGTSFRCFIDGVLKQYATSATSWYDGYAWGIGGLEPITGWPGGFFNGYISNLRALKGSIPTAYQTASTTAGAEIFTPPTAPLTAVTNTQLLLNCTNADIIDNDSKNNLKLVGNTAASATQTKYAARSVYFDGTGDYITATVSPEFVLGTGDFTLECWVYPTTVATTYQGIFDLRSSGSQIVPTFGFNTNTLIWYVNGSFRITSGTVTANAWYHVAVVRSSSETKMYINGTQSGSTYTDTNNYGANIINIGQFFDGYSLNGYIEDLRITKGLARYTANFTPPTSELLG